MKVGNLKRIKTVVKNNRAKTRKLEAILARHLETVSPITEKNIPETWHSKMVGAKCS